MNLYLLHYNNYYNRTIKREASLAAYITHAIGDAILNVNFNPNDGVTTEHIINWSNESLPDYVLVVDNNIIISRWFVLECARTRGGQYRLDLKRDVIADNWSQLIQSPIFIDKAKCPVGDIAELNKEDYKFNSIKQSEHLLKDESGCAWLVGYCSNKDVGDDDSEYTLSGKVRFPISPDLADYNLTDTASYFNKFNMLHSTTIDASSVKYYGSINDIRIQLNTYGTTKGVHYSAVGHERNNLSFSTVTTPYDDSSLPTLYNNVVKDLTEDAKGVLEGQFRLALILGWFNDINSYYAAAATNNTPSQLNSVLDENGKVLYCSGNGKYYTISVTPTERLNTLYVTASYPDLFNSFEEFKNGFEYDELGKLWTLGTTSAKGYMVQHRTNDYTIKLIEIGANNININYTIPNDSTRQHLTDAPYDMFCMPLSSEKVFWNGSSGLQSNKDINVAAAMSIVADLAGVGFVYDCQILPYCPLGSQYLGNNDRINLVNISSHGTITYSSGGSNYPLGYILFCSQSQFEFTIDYPVYIEDTKRQHQTDNWRFQSPNWASAYDFDAALNRGMTYIDVDCTYKPFTPYIHVCPRFNSGGYYGYNNNDAYGLICAGDFSLPMVTDQWKTYEYSNKNYENSFNRQIQNLKTNYKLDMVERGIGALTGSVTGGATGALMGGPIGAAIGGAVSLGAGVADQFMAKARQEETVSYATDQFEYQIDNIKSLPNTISKVSAFNTNNKLFPFIEHYSCSEREKEIYNDLIKWNGASINRVGTISEFLDEELQYFSGRLIRLEGLYEESHMVSAIAKELAQGVFL